MEVRAMASGAPLLPCTLCGQVPGRPDRRPDGVWRIACPICGRESLGETEDSVRRAWADTMDVPKGPGSKEIQAIDSAVELMCEVESIRTVPGAMDVWHRWLDCANELKRLIETHSQTASENEEKE